MVQERLKKQQSWTYMAEIEVFQGEGNEGEAEMGLDEWRPQEEERGEEKRKEQRGVHFWIREMWRA